MNRNTSLDRKIAKVKREIAAKANTTTRVESYGFGLCETRCNMKTGKIGLYWMEASADIYGKRTVRYIPIERYRLKQLTACIKLVGEKNEQGGFTQNDLETVLNYLYAELNRRLNKAEKNATTL